MNVYVEALRKAGQRDEALRVAEELWQITQKALDPDGFHALSNQRVLGALYGDAGRFDQGIKLLEEVLQKHRQLDGPQHPETLQSSDYLAAAYAQAGQTEKAVSLLEETMQGRRETLGVEHPRTLESLILLGSLYLQRGQYEQAEPLLREACDGFTKRREASPTPYDAQQCRKALEQLVQLYEKSNQPEKATAWKEKLDTLKGETTKIGEQ